MPFSFALVPSVTVKSESVRTSCSERTSSQSSRSDKITLGSHGNSAFQPITASCKIIPQGQVPSPSESPGKSFQPITMSCKIVSGEHRCTEKIGADRSVESCRCDFPDAASVSPFRFKYGAEYLTVCPLATAKSTGFARC